MSGKIHGVDDLVRSETISDDCKLSLGAGAGCLATGAVGWIANAIAPGSTALGALLFVAVFYLSLALASYFSGAGRE